MFDQQELERIEKTLERNLEDFEIHGGMVRYWVSIEDAKKLLREYRAVKVENTQLQKTVKQLEETIKRLAMDPNNVFALRAEAMKLTNQERK